MLESVERKTECWKVSESGGRESVPNSVGGYIFIKILVASYGLGCVGGCGRECEKVSESEGRENMPNSVGGHIFIKVLIVSFVLGCFRKCGKEGECWKASESGGN